LLVYKSLVCGGSNFRTNSCASDIGSKLLGYHEPVQVQASHISSTIALLAWLSAIFLLTLQFVGNDAQNKSSVILNFYSQPIASGLLCVKKTAAEKA